LILAEIAGKVYRSAKTITQVLTCFGFAVAGYEKRFMAVKKAKPAKEN